MANSTKTEQKAFIALLGLLVVLVCFLLYPFLNAIILAIVFAVLFQPVHRRCLKWTGGRENVTSFLSTAAVVVFLVLPLAAFLTLVAGQLADLAADQAPSTQPSVSDVIFYLQRKLTYLSGKFEKFIGIQLDLVPVVRKGMSQIGQSVARYSPQVLAGTANFFLHLFVMLTLLFYLFRDGKKFIQALIRITPIKDRYERKLAGEIQETIEGVFYGSFLTALLQGAVALVGFFVIGVEGSFVWSVITFFTSFLPTIGTGAVTVPLFITLLLQGNTTKALAVLAYGGIVIGGIDQVLRPFLMRSNIHPMLLFLGIFGGLVVFGPIGLLLGPLLMALVTATIRIYAEDFAGVDLPQVTSEKKPRSGKT
ncbi:MAG TPA: AI-2E family transporter [bacterium]|nr:AI-2E family transporter [bacterium]